MRERQRIRTKAYDRLSQSLGLEEEANQTDEPEAEPVIGLSAATPEPYVTNG